jgi:uncharacterized protein YeaO (DUF488 family)
MHSLQDASVFDLRTLTVEAGQERYGLRILVMRAWPRGVPRRCLDLWVPDAGPSRDLLRRYRDQELDWEQFRAAYIQEQSEARSGRLIVYPHNGIVDRIETRYSVRPVALLAWYARRQQTTLLCWERSGNCHRQVLMELVEQAVIARAEIEALQKLPTFAAPSFFHFSSK